jgi:hypothetical protein
MKKGEAQVIMVIWQMTLKDILKENWFKSSANIKGKYEVN